MKSKVMVKSTRELKGKTTEDTRFYITSIEPIAQKLLNIVRECITKGCD
jgi:hypothetical protein